jgi:hypothetical protein
MPCCIHRSKPYRYNRYSFNVPDIKHRTWGEISSRKHHAYNIVKFYKLQKSRNRVYRHSISKSHIPCYNTIDYMYMYQHALFLEVPRNDSVWDETVAFYDLFHNSTRSNSAITKLLSKHIVKMWLILISTRKIIFYIDLYFQI